MRWPRRRLLAWAALSAVPGAAIAAEAPTGWVEPRLPTPPLRVIAADGRRMPLASLLAGKVTLVQLMFTGCSSTCPPQGAFFAALAGRLRSSDAQLLSISIDALGDTPATVTAWQARFGKSDAWHAAVADVADVDRLADFLKGAAGKHGTHTAQVFVFDPLARLSYRSGDWPSVNHLEATLSTMIRAA